MSTPNRFWPNRFWIAGAVIAVGMATALVATIQASALDYVEVTALVDHPATYRDKAVKLTGKVVASTIVVGLDEAGRSTLEFDIADARGARIRVFHRGPRPDALRDGGVVLLEGALERGAMRFTASTLLAQCPSRYEEQLAASPRGGASPGSADAASHGAPVPSGEAPASRRPEAP